MPRSTTRPAARRRTRQPARPDTLTAYRKKRDFARTREPDGGRAPGTTPRGALQFVIQKHHASHLHFDLRLQVDGVMKSWAVPKGPSRDPKVKRLAMQVEDHPIAYNSFEGTIPKGEYGGGTVMIWDRGTYTALEGREDEIRASLAKGRLKFTLHGERLHGMWTLARMRQERQWLLIKHHDDYDVANDELAGEDVASVVTGRRMSEIAEGSKPVLSPPLLPMLASVGKEMPVGDEWAFEPKYDGIRVLAFVDRDEVALISRNGRDKAAQFPEVVGGLRALSTAQQRPFVIDGEIVPRTGKTLGRFQDLQKRIGQASKTAIAKHAKDSPVTLVAFDILLEGDEPLIGQPWTERRQRLEQLFSAPLTPGLTLGEVTRGNGTRQLARAKRAGWEGIMAKRVDAPYSPGDRTKAWRKLKIEGRQEFVVGGWTDPRGSRGHIGALLIGYWEGSHFIYAGRVGAGFTQQGLGDLFATLHKIERQTTAFSDPPRGGTAVIHWVKPSVVVEVKFNEWTAGGHLRQPVFLGVRDDKDARAVVRESSAVVGAKAGKSAARARAPSGDEDVSKALQAIEAEGGKGVVDIPNAEPLHVTNLNKVYFPEARRTKGDLMRYYERVSPVLLPLIADRPLVLKRYPNGVTARPFFQQNAPDDAPASLHVGTVPSESTTGRRIIGGDLYTLLYCVQLGAIDVNPWHSRLGSLDFPDYTILDLDPGPKATFASVVRVALALKELLDGAKLQAGIKTSGSRGLHMVIPLPPRTTEQAALLVAQILAEQVAHERPKEATVLRSRAARPPAAVYVDYLQNIVGKSVASAFSVRPRSEATVSTPLSWDEVTSRLDPAAFTMDVVAEEGATRGALWHAAMSVHNRLGATHRRAPSE